MSAMGSNVSDGREGAAASLWNGRLPYVVEQHGRARILLADRESMFREGLRALLESVREFVVVGEARDGTSALQLARQWKPDIILLDLEIDQGEGLAVLQALVEAAPTARTLVLSTVMERVALLRALQLGARGMVLKSESGAALFESLRRVMAGEFWLGREGMAELVEALRASGRKPEVPAARCGVTQREADVIAAVVAGYSNHEIAERFGISEQTVKHHLTKVFDKLGVGNRLELALFAVSHGIPARIS